MQIITLNFRSGPVLSPEKVEARWNPVTSSLLVTWMSSFCDSYMIVLINENGSWDERSLVILSNQKESYEFSQVSSNASQVCVHTISDDQASAGNCIAMTKGITAGTNWS